MSITKVTNFVLDIDSVGVAQLDVTPGAAGQVLGIDASGNLEFSNKLVTEDVHDVVAGLIAAGTHTNINIVYDDANNSLSFDATGAVESVNGLTGQVVLSTTNIAEGTNLYWTEARFDTSFNGKSTTDLSEGTNLYFTEARSRSSISATGSLTYNTSTGEISYTERTDNDIRGLFSAGTGVSITNGVIAIDQVVASTSNVTFADITTTGDLQIDGNLTVSGTTTTINAADLHIADNMIYLNDGSNNTNPDLGIAGNYNDGTYAHTGIFRDASDGVWKIYDGYTPEPDASIYIDTTHATYSHADLQVGNFTADGSVTANSLSGDGTNITNVLTNYSTTDLAEGTNLYYTDTRFDNRLAAKSTTDLAEGTNLYFTNERVDDRVSNLLQAGTNISFAYDDNANTLTISSNGLTGNTTDNLTEGTSNLYFTTERAQDAVAAALVAGTNTSIVYDDNANTITISASSAGGIDLSNNDTDDLSEGTANLYYTNERVDDRVAALIQAGANISVTYDDANNTLTIAGEVEDDLSNNNTDQLAEGTTNLYYTDARARTAITFNDYSEFDVVTFDPVTGIFEHTGVTTAQIRSTLSGINGVMYDTINGEIELDPTYSPQFVDMTLTGNLTVQGTTTTVNTQEILLADNIITLNSDLGASFSPSENAGIEINRGSASNVALRWNESSDTWQFTNDGVTYQDIGSLSSSNTDDLAEGPTNLYFTDERAQDAVAAMLTTADNISMVYDDANNTFTIGLDTTGGMNLGNNTTTDLPEGTNLYYTDERVDDRVATLIQGGDHITVTYDDVANTLTIDGIEDDLSNNTTTDLAEGTNLYYTDARADARVDILRTDLNTSGSVNVHFDNLTNVPMVSHQTINGTGTTNYTMNVDPGTADGVLVTIAGVMQTPGSDYQVSGTTITFPSGLPTGQTAQLRFVSYATAGGGTSGSTSSSSNDLPIAGGTMSGSILVDTDNSYDLGSSTNQWRTIYGHDVEATYADLAERYATDAPYNVGTVVVFGGEAEITVTNQEADVSVAGIISGSPALKMNAAAGNNQTHPYVALKGRVPCQVIGPVKKGDLLVTASKPGFAKSVGKIDAGHAVIGKALETNLTDGIKMVEVAVV